MTVVFAAVSGLAAGFLLGRLGSWWRMKQTEARLREVALAAHILEDMGDHVPAEWVADQIDWVVREEFR